MYPNCVTLDEGKKKVRSAAVGAQAKVFEKSATELKHKQKLLKHKSKINVAAFNVRTLSRIDQLAELIASVVEHKIDIVSVHEHMPS